MVLYLAKTMEEGKMNDMALPKGLDWRVEAALGRLIFNIAAAREVLLEDGYLTLARQLERDAQFLEHWLDNNRGRGFDWVIPGLVAPTG